MLLKNAVIFNDIIIGDEMKFRRLHTISAAIYFITQGRLRHYQLKSKVDI